MAIPRPGGFDRAAVQRLLDGGPDPEDFGMRCDSGRWPCMSIEAFLLLAALGRAQLARLDTLIERRRQINHRYREELAAIDGIEFLPEAAGGRSNCWLTCLLIDEERLGVGPEQLRQQLEGQNIEARPVWKPMHLQPAHRDCHVVGGAVAEDVFLRGLCMPSGSALSEEDQGRVLEAFLRTPGLVSSKVGV
jgi:dTDP-4-amino-4,6-dideoxygalactose transaminase